MDYRSTRVRRSHSPQVLPSVAGVVQHRVTSLPVVSNRFSDDGTSRSPARMWPIPWPWLYSKSHAHGYGKLGAWEHRCATAGRESSQAGWEWGAECWVRGHVGRLFRLIEKKNYVHRHLAPRTRPVTKLGAMPRPHPSPSTDWRLAHSLNPSLKPDPESSPVDELGVDDGRGRQC